MKKQPIYIIEHLEPELFEWCLIEYEHISEVVGLSNLWFTNIKNSKDKKKLEKFGKVYSESVKDLIEDLKLFNICVLDPESNQILEPSDSFEYYIFGGILGDYPPKKRTQEELTSFVKNCEVRNIGKEQMSTDNAVFSVKQIVSGKQFKKLKFKDGISVEINEFENVDLPYRYNLVNGKPFISKKIKEYLKKKKGF
jgi:ribosome biogenesis SPOUT family RNA methylase Rps3